MSAEEGLHTKYISFKNNNSNERILGLKLDKLVNTKLRYEWFNKIGVLDQVSFQGKQMCVNQIIMKAKLNGILLFNRIE